MIREFVEFRVENGEKIFDIKETLSNLDFEIINKCFSELANYNGLKTLFQMSIDNYSDLIRFLEHEVVGLENIRYVGHHTNRFLINYLSSTKMFIEHTEKKIDKIYGEDSEEFIRWKKATAEEYDKHFSYRFLYQLRNYTQHYGLPLGSISSSLVETNGVESQFTKVSFRKEILLNTSFNWKKVKTDIENRPEEFSVVETVNEYNRCMSRLYQVALLIIGEKVISAIQDYAELLARLNNKGVPHYMVFKDYKDLSNPKKYGKAKRLPFKEVDECLQEMSKYGILNTKSG